MVGHFVKRVVVHAVMGLSCSARSRPGVVRCSDDDDHRDTGLTITWSETDDHPARVYRPGSDGVEALSVP